MKRGFASMSQERRKQVASMGGKTAHKTGAAHVFSPEEARAAAAISNANGHTHHFTSAEASRAGKKGAITRAAKRAGKAGAA